MRPEYRTREIALQEKQEPLRKLLRIATGNHCGRIDDGRMEIGRNHQDYGYAVECKRVCRIDDSELGVAALDRDRSSTNVQCRDNTAFQISGDAGSLQRGIRVQPGRGKSRVGHGNSALVIARQAGEIGQGERFTILCNDHEAILKDLGDAIAGDISPVDEVFERFRSGQDHQVYRCAQFYLPRENIGTAKIEIDIYPL